MVPQGFRVAADDGVQYHHEIREDQFMSTAERHSSKISIQHVT
jgi:hypothetical protein